MKDLPESTQLCFSLISVHSSTNSPEQLKQSNTKQRGVHAQPSKIDQFQLLGWTNFRIFDWRSHLIQGKQTLYLRPFKKVFYRIL
jgi:hypothetical protein